MHTQQTISMKLLPEPRKLLAARTICINLYPSQFSWDLLELRKKTAIHFRSMKVLRIGSWRFRMFFALWLSATCESRHDATVDARPFAEKHGESRHGHFLYCKCVLKCVLPSWMARVALNLRKLPAKRCRFTGPPIFCRDPGNVAR